MKKSILITAISACVSASAAMADFTSYCPQPINVDKAPTGKFEGFGPGPVVTVFQEKFSIDSKKYKEVGGFGGAAYYAPDYHNKYGQIACNYEHATLWLVEPTSVATPVSDANWRNAGKNAQMCGSTDPIACGFTVQY